MACHAPTEIINHLSYQISVRQEEESALYFSSTYPLRKLYISTTIKELMQTIDNTSIGLIPPDALDDYDDFC